MLISVAIFAVVMTIALGALLAMTESDRKAQTLKSVINNLNFSLDSMSRAIRTGQLYHCGSSGTLSTPQDCSGAGATYLAFKPADATLSMIIYCLGTVAGACSDSGTLLLRSIDGGSTFSAVTASEVKISRLRFIVVGAEGFPVGGTAFCSSNPSNSGCLQPKVTIVMSGFVQSAGSATAVTGCTPGVGSCAIFNLQTSITQRLYDQ